MSERLKPATPFAWKSSQTKRARAPRAPQHTEAVTTPSIFGLLQQALQQASVCGVHWLAPAACNNLLLEMVVVGAPRFQYLERRSLATPCEQASPRKISTKQSFPKKTPQEEN